MPRREPFASHSAGAARSTLSGQSLSDTLDLPCLALSTLRCQTPVWEDLPPAPRLLTILNTFRDPLSGPDTFKLSQRTNPCLILTRALSGDLIIPIIPKQKLRPREVK